MPLPSKALMCPPDYFEVLDVKNPFMKSQLGKVDRSLAVSQWKKMKSEFERVGLQVVTLDPTPGCEDMVFTANQTFLGLSVEGKTICVVSHMKHPSRQREVPAFRELFSNLGYEVRDIGNPTLPFEGGGDAIWHPGRRLIWGGVGARTNASVYPELSELFDAPVITLELISENFYHLDTCFCAIDESTVMIFPEAIAPHSLRLIEKVFPRIIRASREEAIGNLACNAAAFLGRYVFIQKGSRAVTGELARLGYEVIELDTGEFIKSGGSVFCMKMALY